MLSAKLFELFLFPFLLLLVFILHPILILIVTSVLLQFLFEFSIKLLYIDLLMAVSFAILLGPAQTLLECKFFLCF